MSCRIQKVKYRAVKLANKLRVLTVPMSSMESATVSVWVGSGARNDPPKSSGISHFLEHMAFKGTKKRTTAREIAAVIDGIGGEFNASTSKEWINFYIKARTQTLELMFDVLSDLILSPVFATAEIEKEKRVVLEEISLHEDSPTMKIGDYFEETIFGGHPLAKDISGTRESVKSFKRTELLRYIKSHFHTDKMLVSVAGGVKPQHVEDLAKKYFGSLTSRKTTAKAKKFKITQNGPKVRVLGKKSEQAHLILGHFCGPRNSKTRFPESILVTVLGRGMSSRLHDEIREKHGLAYSVGSSIERYIDTGYLETYIGVDPKRIDEAIKVLQDQIYGLASGSYPIGREELLKAKEDIKGRLALSLEDTHDVNYFFSEDFLFGIQQNTPEEIFAKVDRVTLEDVMAAAKKIFRPKFANLAIIGPFKNEDRFDKLLAS